MHTKVNLSNISSNSQLKAYLASKAKKHHSYKLYASRKKIESIIEKNCIYLSKGNNWNDAIDKANFNQPTSDYHCFGMCLSYSKSENMAMWMLYSGNEGLMLNFNKTFVSQILDSEAITLGYFDNEKKTFVEIKKITKPNFEIDVIDMIYYGESTEKGKYYVKRADESYKFFDADLIEQATYYKKTLPWSYENECRIVVKINRNLIPDSSITTVAIDLPKKLHDDLLKKVYESPNVSNPTYTPSAMKGKINWKLYKDCTNCDKKEV